VFALEGDTIHLVADPKPKDGLDLLRHRNIAANAAVSLLVDEYHEPWRGIWWVRADGKARVIEDGADRDRTIELLRAKYADYEEWTTPFGAATRLSVERWRSWTM
jgi:PPOX class probable F420-dependent enzyme